MGLVFAGVAYTLYIPGIVLFLLLPLRVAVIGFYAVPWAFYLRASEDRTLAWYEMFGVTWSYFRRFLRLGLIVLGAVVIPVSIGVVAVLRHQGWHGSLVNHPPSWYLLTVVTMVVVVDALLTFATPALVYSTDLAVDALGSGFRLMRATWPSSAPYVLTPGLTLSVIGLILPRSILGVGGNVAIAAVGAVIGLAFKGAIASFYLRNVGQADRMPLMTNVL